MFSDPAKNIEQFQLGKGMIVVDFGVGAGEYTFAAAKVVEKEGSVYACDVQKDLLRKVAARAQDERLTNINILWCDLEEPQGSKLTTGSVDAVIISNILFQIENKQGLILEAERILRAGGRLLILDWADSFNNLGPHTDHIVSKETVLSLLKDTVFEKEINAGAHHYGLIARKK